VRLNPDSAEAHRNLGSVLRQQGKFDEAVASCRRALELQPDYAPAYNTLGIALQAQKRYAEAQAQLEQAVRLAPEMVDAHFNLGNVLRQQGKYEQAVTHCREVQRLDPDFADGYANLGAVFHDQLRFDEAREQLEQALRLDPRSVEVRANLSLVLQGLGRLDEALARSREALAIDPGSAPALASLASGLQEAADYAAAEASFQRTLELDPGSATAHFGLALCRLTTGDFRRGWTEYQWRWEANNINPQTFTQPMWNGEPLDGRTILLRHEQGDGDTLQFVRYAPLVKRLGATVLLHCRRSLAALLTTCQGVDSVHVTGDPTPKFDYHVPLLSLPGIFQTELDTIPAQVPYIWPPEELVGRWRGELPAGGPLKVGIVWRGSPMHRRDRRRSIPLEHFAPLASIDGVQLYSLQVGGGNDELRTFSAADRVIDLAGRIESFQDTAAIMRNLDLVVSCDSAPIHLAGALGVNVWAALPFSADWRWLSGREDSPWYPTLRLFRQTALGDWSAVFAALIERLRRLAAQARGDSPKS
jgi:tetratricopeptide (TPR) repeat protein